MTIKELYELLLTEANGNEDAVVLFHGTEDFLDADGAWCLHENDLVVIDFI